jgi:hypothetical protein
MTGYRRRDTAVHDALAAARSGSVHRDVRTPRARRPYRLRSRGAVPSAGRQGRIWMLRRTERPAISGDIAGAPTRCHEASARCTIELACIDIELRAVVVDIGSYGGCQFSRDDRYGRISMVRGRNVRRYGPISPRPQLDATTHRRDARSGSRASRSSPAQRSSISGHMDGGGFRWTLDPGACRQCAVGTSGDIGRCRRCHGSAPERMSETSFSLVGGRCRARHGHR